MAGVVAFFTRIDASVEAIFTTDGIERGPAYFRNGDGAWVAG